MLAVNILDFPAGTSVWQVLYMVYLQEQQKPWQTGTSCKPNGFKMGQTNRFNLTGTRNQTVFWVCLMLQFHMTWKLKGFVRLVSSFLNHPSGEWAQRHLTPGFAAVFSPACFVARLLVNLQIMFDISLKIVWVINISGVKIWVHLPTILVCISFLLCLFSSCVLGDDCVWTWNLI